MAHDSVRAPRRAAVFFLKIVLFVVLFALFFGLFALEYPWIITANRTSAITMSTFVILGIAMTAVYGGFAVGKRKSKEIIPPLCIATFITDAVTWFQLSIMNTNQSTQYEFEFASIGIFLLVFILQAFAIVGFVYLGNFVFFKLNPPEESIVICSDPESAGEMVRKISRYKKQYHITNVIDWKDPGMKRMLRHSDTVFLLDLPANVKTELIDYAYKHFVNLYIQTELSDIVVNYAKYNVFDDMSMLSSTTKELSIEQKILKRTIDILLSGLFLILVSPIMLAEALAIKLYDGGPVFFRQERVTYGGKLFNVLKFRTMIVDADKKMGMHPAGERDDRITPVGRVLRKLRLDELPQFLNILKGDMSIVGPRPERVEHVEMYTQELPEFQYRLRAKAGLTGLAQIAGKYNTSPRDKLTLDLMYIERYSVWMDILLIFQTLKVFFKSDSTEAFSDEQNVQFVKYGNEHDPDDLSCKK